jgi:hypothetical protein
VLKLVIKFFYVIVKVDSDIFLCWKYYNYYCSRGMSFHIIPGNGHHRGSLNRGTFNDTIPKNVVAISPNKLKLEGRGLIYPFLK